MSENAVSSSGSTKLSNATRPLPRAWHRAWHRVQRMAPVMALAAMLVLALGLALGSSSPVYARITPPYTPDFKIKGDSLLQQFGFSVASAGDVNHDGFGDVIVGAANLNDGVYIYLGSANGLTTTAYYSDTELFGEKLGWSVSGGADVNDDNIDDFIGGAPGNASGQGAAYVYSGSSIALPTRVATLTGELAGDQFGWSVAMIGDVNHDGKGDIGVGAPNHNSNTGRVYVYYAPISDEMTPSLTLDGEDTFQFFGNSVAAAGDVNGDGIDDLVVGAPQNDEGGLDAGKAYVFYGSDSGLSQSNHTAITGSANEKWGTSVHGAGDTNGDGFADVIVGSDTKNPIGVNLGRAAVYPGGPSGLISTPLFSHPGEFDDDQYGFAVAGDGDINGDGFSDFAVGAYLFDAHRPVTSTNEGKAYGYSGCGDSNLRPSLIFSDTGKAQNDSYGHALAIVNDVNGDGLDDLVVGADTISDTLFSVGNVFGYYGVEGGCRPALQLTQLVSLANYPHIYTDTSAITVPTDAAIRYTYSVRNTGTVPLTQQNAVDDKWGLLTNTAYTLTPGANISVNVSETPGLIAAPGVTVTNVATWTGALSISTPSGVTLPANRVLSAFDSSAAQVTISGPTTDQDHDGAPDNQEGSGDSNHNQIPAYLDSSEIITGTPPDGGSPDVAIQGLSISAPITGYVDSPVVFTADVTAGTNVSYTWDFGDGQSSSISAAAIQSEGNQVVSHTFAKVGNYTIHATATNSLGQQTTQSSITIRFQLRLPNVVTIGFAGAP